MSRQRQLSFFKPSLKEFGGSLIKGNPKVERPLANNRPVHLVLKSNYATGARSMLNKHFVKRIDFLVRSHAQNCNIKIYQFVNVGNHLHLVLKIQDRVLYRKFIRTITGVIARMVLNSERGLAKGSRNRNKISPASGYGDISDGVIDKIKSLKFWFSRPYTRIATWGSEFKTLVKYMDKNRAQAKHLGFRVAKTLGKAVTGFDLPEPPFSTA